MIHLSEPTERIMSLGTLPSDTWTAHWPEGCAVSCPRCGKPTTSLKQYRVCSFLLFLFLAASWRARTLTACPRCMRKHLTVRTLANIVPANLLWPLVLLGHGFLFLATFTRGHSRGVIQDLRAD